MKNSILQTEGANRPLWMIVDDNEDILSLMREAAARFSHARIVCFDSPRAALAAFEAGPELFELVITDFEMPGMDGVELCRRLRAILPSAKILLTTGSDLVSEETAAHEGFCGLLPKPFPFATLRRVLKGIGVLDNQKTAGANDFSAVLTSA